jgi:hypothetical protein
MSVGRFVEAVVVGVGPVDGESRPSGALWRFFETAFVRPWPAGDNDELVV